MARSYKKNPIVKDNGKGKKWQKNQANRRVRHIKDDGEGSIIADGNAYQKAYNSWNIADFVCRWSKEEATKEYYERCNPYSYGGHWATLKICEEMAQEFKEKYPTLEDYLQRWIKNMKRK